MYILFKVEFYEVSYVYDNCYGVLDVVEFYCGV